MSIKINIWTSKARGRQLVHTEMMLSFETVTRCLKSSLNMSSDQHWPSPLQMGAGSLVHLSSPGLEALDESCGRMRGTALTATKMERPHLRTFWGGTEVLTSTKPTHTMQRMQEKDEALSV